jgi:hypothetical protein
MTKKKARKEVDSLEKYGIPLLLSLVTTLLNYIFINSISSSNQKQTILDLKSVLDYIRTDTMNEIKLAREQIIAEIKEQGEMAKPTKSSK